MPLHRLLPHVHSHIKTCFQVVTVERSVHVNCRASCSVGEKEGGGRGCWCGGWGSARRVLGTRGSLLDCVDIPGHKAVAGSLITHTGGGQLDPGMDGLNGINCLMNNFAIEQLY